MIRWLRSWYLAKVKAAYYPEGGRLAAFKDLPAIPEQRGVTVKYAEPSDKVRPKPKRRVLINLLDRRKA